MILTNEQYQEKIQLLKNMGMKINGDKITPYYISNKHISRWMILAKWMRNNGIKMTEENLETLYRFDVTLRRKLSEILKPIEIEISTWTQYFLENNSFDIELILEQQLYEELSDFSSELKQKKTKTIKFVKKATKGILRRNKGVKFSWEVVEKMTFGQLTGFISLLKEEYIDVIFSEKNSVINKVLLNVILDEIVCLRNLIAHNNILLTTSKILSNNREVNLKAMLQSLDLITRGNYVSKLKKELNSYKAWNIKKSSDVENVEKIFKVIFTELFGV